MDGAHTRTRVLLADDHEIVRLGLNRLLAGTRDFEVIGEANSAASTLRGIDTLRPDIVVLDFTLGDESAAQVLDELATRADPPKVLMFSMEDERVVGGEMVRRGAAAYLMKHAPATAILAALHKIRVTMQSVRAPSQPLTNRERAVLMHLKEGLASKAIARRMSISARTVDVYKHRLRRKLGLRTDLELARYAAMFAVIA